MTTERTIWTEANDGSTVTLFSCAICGASVQRRDKETHEAWHGRKLPDMNDHGKPRQTTEGMDVHQLIELVRSEDFQTGKVNAQVSLTQAYAGILTALELRIIELEEKVAKLRRPTDE